MNDPAGDDGGSAPHPRGPRTPLLDTLEAIWRARDARGFRGRSREEIDADVAALRAEGRGDEGRWREIESRLRPSDVIGGTG